MCRSFETSRRHEVVARGTKPHDVVRLSHSGSCYGERAKLAAEGLFGLSFGTLAVYGTVCRSFESLSRLKDVPPGVSHRGGLVDQL